VKPTGPGDEEVADIREMLGQRYDEIVSGKVKRVDGEQTFGPAEKEERRSPSVTRPLKPIASNWSLATIH
jgi:hypothetical protein